MTDDVVVALTIDPTDEQLDKLVLAGAGAARRLFLAGVEAERARAAVVDA
jgi:hypothetical protein